MFYINDQRPTRAEICMDDLAFNLRSVRDFIGQDIKCMAVVKANAYGHGAVECSRWLVAEGVEWLGVALPEEGFELRQAGIAVPVLCLGGCWPGQESAIVEHQLTPVVYQLSAAERLDRAAGERGRALEVHVKIDTGMGRIGLRYDKVADFVAKLASFENLRVDGLMTHFSAADDPRENDFTQLQIDRFSEAVAIFKSSGFSPTYIDLANSPGAIGHPNALGNMVRLGGVLYGLGEDVLPAEIAKPPLKPVMTLRSCVAELKTVPAGESIGYGRTFFTSRDSLIASVPAGYADGYSRNLSNKSKVIVRGKKAPVVGTISMDWITVDVTEVPETSIGDDVVLFGTVDDVSVTAAELASLSGTISYEITTRIGSRVPRVPC